MLEDGRVSIGLGALPMEVCYSCQPGQLPQTVTCLRHYTICGLFVTEAITILI